MTTGNAAGSTAPGALLLRGVRPWGGAPTDVLIERGRIAALGPGLPVHAGAAVEECGGALAFPGLVEAHTYLDKTLWGMPWYRSEVGPRLIDRIDNERRMRPVPSHAHRMQLQCRAGLSLRDDYDPARREEAAKFFTGWVRRVCNIRKRPFWAWVADRGARYSNEARKQAAYRAMTGGYEEGRASLGATFV